MSSGTPIVPEITRQEVALEPEIPSIILPSRFRRAAVRKRCTWHLPRSFAGFKAVDPSDLSVRGAAPKCMIVSNSDPHLWYMAKGSEKWGQQETYTEFFINQLGEALGFPMAHSGLVYVGDELRFVSKNFLVPEESLTHGSILLESFFECDLEKVGKNPWDEQRTYDIEMIDELLRNFCREEYPSVIKGFVEMLVFDGLIGSMDRHKQNWGIAVTTTTPRRYRFAPIFDSARALFWDYSEDRLQRISVNEHAMLGYANRARPKIGCAKFGRTVNHFSLISYLREKFASETMAAYSKVTVENVRKAAIMMKEYPFRSVFSPLRKRTILRILDIRAARIEAAIAQKGEGQ